MGKPGEATVGRPSEDWSELRDPEDLELFNRRHSIGDLRAQHADAGEAESTSAPAAKRVARRHPGRLGVLRSDPTTWEAATGEARRTLEVARTVGNVLFSSDSQYITTRDPSFHHRLCCALRGDFCSRKFTSAETLGLWPLGRWSLERVE